MRKVIILLIFFQATVFWGQNAKYDGHWVFKGELLSFNMTNSFEKPVLRPGNFDLSAGYQFPSGLTDDLFFRAVIGAKWFEISGRNGNLKATQFELFFLYPELETIYQFDEDISAGIGLGYGLFGRQNELGGFTQWLPGADSSYNPLVFEINADYAISHSLDLVGGIKWVFNDDIVGSNNIALNSESLPLLTFGITYHFGIDEKPVPIVEKGTISNVKIIAKPCSVGLQKVKDKWFFNRGDEKIDAEVRVTIDKNDTTLSGSINCSNVNFLVKKEAKKVEKSTIEVKGPYVITFPSKNKNVLPVKLPIGKKLPISYLDKDIFTDFAKSLNQIKGANLIIKIELPTRYQKKYESIRTSNNDIRKYFSKEVIKSNKLRKKFILHFFLNTKGGDNE